MTSPETTHTSHKQIAVAKALVNVRTQLTLRNDDAKSDVDAAVVCVEPELAPKLAFIEVSGSDAFSVTTHPLSAKAKTGSREAGKGANSESN